MINIEINSIYNILVVYLQEAPRDGPLGSAL